jgi:hypothetical protein
MRIPLTGVIDATAVISLPNPMADRVCSYLIQFESSSFSGSVTIKGGALDSNYTILGLGYKNMVTGLNATAAITDNAMVLVDASGIGLALDATVVSGSLRYTAVPLIG